MAKYMVNRTTFRITEFADDYDFTSEVHTSKFSNTDYLSDATLAEGIEAVQARYREISGTTLQEMDEAAKVAVDLERLPGKRVLKNAFLDEQIETFINSNCAPRKQRTMSFMYAQAQAVSYTGRAAYIALLLNWIKSAALYGAVLEAEVSAAASIAVLNAIEPDFTALQASYDGLNGGADVTISGADAIDE